MVCALTPSSLPHPKPLLAGQHLDSFLPQPVRPEMKDKEKGDRETEDQGAEGR